MRSPWRVRLAAPFLASVCVLVAGACGGSKFAGGTSDTAGAAGASGVAGTAGASGVAGAPMAGTSGAAGGADPSAAVPKSGMLYWYAGDRGLTQVSGAISRWADQSGNGADAAQVVTASRPKKSTFHGLPAVEFDGVDDYLVTPQVDGDFSAGVTFFALALPSADSACTGIVELSNGTEIDDVSFTDQSQALTYEVYNENMTSPLGGLAPNEVRLIEVVQDGPSASIWLDGVASGTMDLTPAAVVSRTQNFVGRSLYADCQTFSGQMLEVMLYARALSKSERETVESYLQTKWGCCQG
jgi:hypothetical protein